VARVVFSSAQRALVDGAESVEIEARRVNELIETLYERYPRLVGELDRAAVAIDGDIHNEGRYLPLEPTSEVHFVGRVSGG
jgi:molybdopterin converting factor small subunit